MGYIIFPVIFFVFSIVVGVVASKRGRFGFGYFLLSLILTPFIVLFIILVLGETDDVRIKRENNYIERANFNLRRNTVLDENKIKKCLQCYKLVTNDVMFCPYCGSIYFQKGNKSIKDWKIVFIENNLGKYIDVFEKNNLSKIESFFNTNDSVLESVGILDPEDRNKILLLIEYRKMLIT